MCFSVEKTLKYYLEINLGQSKEQEYRNSKDSGQGHLLHLFIDFWKPEIINGYDFLTCKNI